MAHKLYLAKYYSSLVYGSFGSFHKTKYTHVRDLDKHEYNIVEEKTPHGINKYAVCTIDGETVKVQIQNHRNTRAVLHLCEGKAHYMGICVVADPVK